MKVVMAVELRALDPQLFVTERDGADPAPRAMPYRDRGGGKEPAESILKPIKSHSKRAKFLRWFLEEFEAGRSIGATMATFKMTRPNVLAYWTAIHREHGIGYSLVHNTITVRLPSEETTPIFGGEHV